MADEERVDDAEVALAVVDGQMSDAVSPIISQRPGLLQQLESVRSIVHAFDSLGPDGNVASLPAPCAQWGPYSLQEEVGRGGFGVVCRAFDPAVERDIAVKLYKGHELPAEPRLIARVRHPNVVTVYGAAVHEGRPGIWMEFIHGRTLAERIETEGPLSPAEATRIGIELCSALAAVHRAELVHQDIKPRNVMEEAGGRIVLMDFGAGVSRRGEATDMGRLAGTPLYMAPEVVLGEPPSPQSDVYSLGVLLFYLLTGTYPVYATSLQDLARMHERNRPVDTRRRLAAMLRELRPEVSRTLALSVATALAHADRRYPAPETLASALMRASRERRGRWLAAGAVTGIAAVVGATWWSVLPRPEVDDRPVRPVVFATAAPASAPAVMNRTVPTQKAAARPKKTASSSPTETKVPVVPVAAMAVPLLETAVAPTPAPEIGAATSAPATTAAPPATLVFKIKPWAEITVDGMALGRVDSVLLPAGPHRLVFSHPDYQPLKRVITLAAGETTTFGVDIRDEGVRRR